MIPLLFFFFFFFSSRRRHTRCYRDWSSDVCSSDLNGTPGVLDCQDAHTVTVVIPAVTITKQVTVVGGGPAVPGATLDYLVHVTNTSANPVNPVVITDNLNAAGAGALTYVAGTATMNGSPNGVSVLGNLITAHH